MQTVFLAGILLGAILGAYALYILAVLIGVVRDCRATLVGVTK